MKPLKEYFDTDVLSILWSYVGVLYLTLIVYLKFGVLGYA